MIGVVTRLRARGVEVTMTPPTDVPDLGANFQVYRVVDGAEVIIGPGVVHRIVNGFVRVNPPDDEGEGRYALSPALVGDLVRSVP